MKIRGIFLDREKNTDRSLTIALPTPERVAVPLPVGCKASVKAGQWVLRGNSICDGETPVHASVSGKVEEIRMIADPDGSYEAVVIKADENQKDAAVKLPRAEDRESFIAAVKASGSPAGNKLEKAKDADVLIINGIESEQYLTAENRCMLDDGELITAGIALTEKLMGIEKAYIAVASDCKEALAAMEKVAVKAPNTTLVKLRGDHPGGSDLMLVNNVTGRDIRPTETAADKNVLILLPSEVAFIASYFETGMPFVERRVTVDGDLVKTPCIMKAPIGTPLSDLLAFADANTKPAEKLIIGGMMTGRSVTDTELPLGAEDSAVLIFMKPIDAGKGSLKVSNKATNCIKCGRCAQACPVKLMPMRIEKALKKRNKAALERLRPDLCIGCGSCTYVCPAKRELNEVMRQAAEVFGGKGGEQS
ncbi:MAG: RnfABCDGE type electron transport complex subunit C [Ruminococcus sp.]|uniref:RnfABCDGE type electron transport complex subunit C n=1 Tax=Ruminococcus sp. TaxID=41978 RepID=UPI0025E326F9|nr:RnfABCDGE type electron transport complex subunit C [Ruminococcus sp.]MBO4866483.1 RnfABCDGE type electron transport complex subunit C [Ruminococcus sp.]